MDKRRIPHLEGILSIFLVLLALAALIFGLQLSTAPHADYKLVEFVDEIVILDESNRILMAGRPGELDSKKLPPEAFKVVVIFDIEGLSYALGDFNDIYLFPLVSPTRVLLEGGYTKEFGDYDSNTPPPTQDAVLSPDVDPLHGRFSLEYLLTSLTKSHFVLFDHSVIASQQSIFLHKFFKSLLTMHGFLGIGFVFFVLNAIILIAWINFGREPLFLALSGTTICMGFISFYFSRVFSEIPYLNQVSFVVYLALPMFASMTGYYWASSQRVRKFMYSMSLVCLASAVLLAFLGMMLPLAQVFTVYKKLVLVALVIWLLMPLLMFGENWKKTFSKWSYSKQAFPLAFLLISIGQINDSLRVYFRSSIEHNVGPYLWFIGLVVICGAITYDIYLRHQDSIKNERSLAIAETTQMVAHDVRKPFHQVDSLLNILVDLNDPEQMRNFARGQIGEIRNSLLHVNTMLEDIIESSKVTKLKAQSIAVETVIQRSLEEIAPALKKAPLVHLSYQFDHRSKTLADPNKLQRVFSNLILNAVQAVQTEAHIWVSVCEDDARDSHLFCVGNSGSYIGEEDRDRLFETLYTKGKPNGTGLGLAIVKRIIESHGGTIWCQSEPFPKKVEFFFTLPRSEGFHQPQSDIQKNIVTHS